MLWLWGKRHPGFSLITKSSNYLLPFKTAFNETFLLFFFYINNRLNSQAGLETARTSHGCIRPSDFKNKRLMKWWIPRRSSLITMCVDSGTENTEPQIILLAQTNKLFIYPSPDLLLSAEASLQIRSPRRLVKSVLCKIRFFFSPPSHSHGCHIQSHSFWKKWLQPPNSNKIYSYDCSVLKVNKWWLSFNGSVCSRGVWDFISM